MATFNALIAICCTILTAYLLFKSKCYAEDGKTLFQVSKPEVNETKLINETKSEREENHPDEKVVEEDQLENGVVLPTVAPATPHQEKHISPQDVHSMQGMDDVNSSVRTNQSDDKTPNKENIPIIDNEQVDEVKFDDLVLNPITNDVREPDTSSVLKAEENGYIKKENRNEIVNNQEHLQENADSIKYQSIDLMKLTVSEPQKDAKESVKKNEELMKTTNPSESNTMSLENLKERLTDENDKGSKDVGILESFKDWKEKQETNEKKFDQEKSVMQSIQRKRYNKKTNYASNECGAKVVAANAEAENTAAVLTENKDLYMLNPCSSNIWFVIELCEKVQVETVEIANFELFSSTPETFKVYFSSRYPTREWSLAGSFVAKSERGVQSFILQEKSYAKFVKIEMVSHFGKEHYCPLSLVRVFGISEVEELEDSEDTTSDHDQTRDGLEISVSAEGKHEDTPNGESKNFLKSATDAVLGLVNKATETLTGKTDKLNETSTGEEHADTKTDEDGSKVDESNQNDEVITKDDEQVVLTDDGVGNTGTSLDNRTKSPANSSSDLVVLLEGDDGDDDNTESNQSDRKCVFHGEIHGNKCADPSSFYWIPYIFKYRICPLHSEENKSRITTSDSRMRITIVNKTVDRSKDVISSSVGEISETSHDSKISNDSTNPFVSSTNFIAKSDITEINREVTADINVAHIASISEDTQERHSESVVNISITHTPDSSGSTEETVQKTSKNELQSQVSSESKSSCDSKTIDYPGLSQLIEDVVPSNAQNDRNTRASTQVLNTEVAKEDIHLVKDKTEKDEAEKQNIDEGDKEKDSHVDVLVINIDEKLGEGKAEVPEKASLNASEPTVESHTTASSSTVSEENSIGDSLSNSTTLIEPSFSQPKPSSLGSLKTSESLSIAAISVKVDKNQTLSDHIDASIKPASISESLSTQTTMIKTTVVTAQSISEVRPSESSEDSLQQHGKNIENKEGLQMYTVASTEKMNSVDPTATKSAGDLNVDSSIRLGSMDATVKLGAADSVVTIGSGSSGNNKESAILKLKNRVKALETNLSLSTLYLEEMSKRYRTALEEQQKQFKMKLNALNLSVFEDKKIIKKQQKNIEELTKQLLQLTLHFKNFTEFTEEQQKKMAERYLFSCTIEAFIIIILLWNCMTRSRSIEHRETRRHSAPSIYANQTHHSKPPLAVTNGDIIMDEIDDLPQGYHLENKFATAMPVSKRKRQRKKKSQSDCNVFIENADSSNASTSRETTIINSTAGVLFSAGRGIISGLTGAFTKQKKPIGSRRTRALVDSNVYDQIRKPFARSKSLGTIEEHEDLDVPKRHRSFESFTSKKSSCRGLEHDKRRG